MLSLNRCLCNLKISFNFLFILFLITAFPIFLLILIPNLLCFSSALSMIRVNSALFLRFPFCSMKSKSFFKNIRLYFEKDAFFSLMLLFMQLKCVFCLFFFFFLSHFDRLEFSCEPENHEFYFFFVYSVEKFFSFLASSYGFNSMKHRAYYKSTLQKCQL